MWYLITFKIFIFISWRYVRMDPYSILGIFGDLKDNLPHKVYKNRYEYLHKIVEFKKFPTYTHTTHKSKFIYDACFDAIQKDIQNYETIFKKDKYMIQNYPWECVHYPRIKLPHDPSTQDDDLIEVPYLYSWEEGPIDKYKNLSIKDKEMYDEYEKYIQQTHKYTHFKQKIFDIKAQNDITKEMNNIFETIRSKENDVHQKYHQVMMANDTLHDYQSCFKTQTPSFHSRMTPYHEGLFNNKIVDEDAIIEHEESELQTTKCLKDLPFHDNGSKNDAFMKLCRKRDIELQNSKMNTQSYNQDYIQDSKYASYDAENEILCTQIMNKYTRKELESKLVRNHINACNDLYEYEKTKRNL